jgi:acetylornithine deacetylase/succinyl-diaminopimelate desuccinylase-like protein
MTPAGADAARFAADLIRIDTTNRGGGDARERPAAEYVAERLAEAGLEPVLLESAPGRANVVARIGGTGAGAADGALLLHGHLDVVPADPADWAVPPFSGEIRDGVLWGRGAVDMKNADAVLIALAAEWARSGRRPRRDVVLAFTADEEDTAEFGSRWLVERHPELFEGCTEAVGESGAFTFHAAGQRLYPIASAERGTAWLRLTARGRAGHGSKPNAANAVTRLAAAVARIGTYRWPVRLIPTVRAAIEAIAAAAGTRLPDGALDGGMTAEELLARLGPARALVAGTVRNSANPTMLSAGYKVNVIPGEAVGYVDGRVLPGYEQEFRAVLDELTHAAGQDVSWEYAHEEIPLEAPLHAPVMSKMAAAVLAEDPGSVVVPYCMSGGTDAKQFSRLGLTCYGFTPLVLPEGYDYYAMFHGTDERIPLSALEASVRIMDRFLEAALCPVLPDRAGPMRKISQDFSADCFPRSEPMRPGVSRAARENPLASCGVIGAWLHLSGDGQGRQSMTVVEIPSRTLGGRFRLNERISLDDQVSGPCGSSWEARGLSLWKATDQLLGRPVTIYLLPRGPVTRTVVDAVQHAAKISDSRLATIYDTDFDPKGQDGPYIVTEWTPGSHLEDLVLSGLPRPALAAAMIADAADALAVAHRAGLPHLRLTPRSVRWANRSGLKITGLGLDAALCGSRCGDPVAADTIALARMLYALLTGYWPGEEATALPPAPRYKGQVCTPRQVRAGVPALLDAIACRGLLGQAADAPLRPQTPAGLALALRMVQRPSRWLERPEEEAGPVPGRPRPGAPRHPRHARAGHRITLLRPVV